MIKAQLPMTTMSRVLAFIVHLLLISLSQNHIHAL